MHRSAKAVLIGLGSAAASVVLVVLGANAASAEEAGPTFNGEPIVAAPTYNGQPIVAASVPLVVAPVVAAPAAAPVVPEFKAAAVTDPGSVPMYNGQPLESMKSTIENTAPLTGPSTANAAPAPPVGSGRRVVYSIHQHRVWLIEENGEVAHSYLVSGKASLPRVGEYRVFSRSAWAYSGSVRMRHMVRFARGSRLAIGFHEIPINRRGAPIQSLGELGQFRSSGCVRQSPDDARRMWDWAPVGTRVTVTR